MAEPAQVAYESTALGPRESVWNEICELGLQSYVADMDAHGYCIIPPEIVNPNNLAARLREALLDVAERRNGERPDVVTGATHAYRPALLHGYDSARYGKDGSEKEETDPALLKQDDAVDSPFGDGMALIFNEGRGVRRGGDESAAACDGYVHGGPQRGAFVHGLLDERSMQEQLRAALGHGVAESVAVSCLPGPVHVRVDRF